MNLEESAITPPYTVKEAGDIVGILTVLLITHPVKVEVDRSSLIISFTVCLVGFA